MQEDAKSDEVRLTVPLKFFQREHNVIYVSCVRESIKLIACHLGEREWPCVVPVRNLDFLLGAVSDGVPHHRSLLCGHRHERSGPGTSALPPGAINDNK